MPTITDYLVDPLLSTMSVGFQNPELIADSVFPRLDVPARTGFYYKFDKSIFRLDDDIRTGISRAKRIDYGMAKVAFGPLKEHSLEEGIEWEVRDSYPAPMDAYADATMNVSGRIALIHENDVAATVTSTTNLTNNTTLSGTSQWSDFNNSDPFTDIQTGLDSVQQNAMITANSVIMGYQVWAKLRNHPDLLGRLSTASVRTLTPDLFAALIGVENVFIGKAMYNSAKEGQTDSMSYVWGKNFVVAYIAPKPGIRIVTLGYTLQLKNGRVVDRWTEQWNKADFVRATDYYQDFLVAAEAGYLVAAAVA